MDLRVFSAAEHEYILLCILNFHCLTIHATLKLIVMAQTFKNPLKKYITLYIM